MLTRSNMHAYQEDLVKFVLEKKKCALFLEMGLGKTVITLTSIIELLYRGEVSKVLVVGPPKVVENVWGPDGDITNWQHLKMMRIVNCKGTKKQRETALGQDAEIYTISNSNFVWLCEQKDRRWKWDMLVIDESSNFKSSDTKRFKALKKNLKYFKSIVLLTGTPMPNSIEDLWSQIYILDRGERLGATKGEYQQKYFVPICTPLFTDFKPKQGANELVMHKIKDICRSMKREDVMKVDVPTRHYEKITMTQEGINTYRKLQSDFIVEMTNGTTITAPSASSKLQKMMQVCNGFVYDEDKIPVFIHKNKIEKLKEITDKHPYKNILVPYNFQADKEMIRHYFKEAVFFDEEKNAQKRWNNGEIKMLCCHPKSAGYGLNLQHGGSVVVWYGLNYSLEQYQQLNARLDRQGQKDKVVIYHIYVEGAVDEKILKVLSSKSKNQNEVMKKLRKEIIENSF